MRYLIVGFGNIGHKRQKILGRKCVATVDPNPKVNAEYINIKDVPLNIFDAVILTIPQQFKYKFTEYFLNRGKHVLVEKPLIITDSQGGKLLKIATKNKVIWYTSYNHRFEPNIFKIKNILQKDLIGKLYHARFVYSFGNIKERIGTWRETKFGVLEEIAPHLIDFSQWFFNYQGKDYESLTARKVESKIFDHWVFCTKDKKILFETSSVTWKNIFSIDIYGEKGSIHMNGLCKWGESELIIRKRVLPSGVPLEKMTSTKGSDISWKKDFLYFEKMIKENKSSVDNDLQISDALQNITKPHFKNER